MNRMRTRPWALAVALAGFSFSAMAHEIEVEEWTSQGIPAPDAGKILLYDADDDKTVQMPLNAFLEAWETHIGDQIVIVHALRKLTTQSISDDTDTPVEFDTTVRQDDPDMHNPSTNNSRLVAPIDGFYMFHAIVEFEGTEDEHHYSACVRKNEPYVSGGSDNGFPAGKCYGYQEKHDVSRQRSIPPNHTSSTPTPPNANYVRVLNVTGTVYLKADQYIELVVKQTSVDGQPRSLELVLDDCSPSMYMRRILE